MTARTHELDYGLLAAVTALVAAGLLTLYSAGQTEVPTVAAELWKRQMMWLGVGVAIAIVVFRVSPRLLEWVAPAVYGVSIVMLVLTLIVGTGAGTAASTKSWLAIGGIRIGQPAELAKIGTILMLGRHLAGRRAPPLTMVDFVPSLVIVSVPFVLP